MASRSAPGSRERASGDIQEVRRIVLDRLGPSRARVWLFGSQVASRVTRASDIDVGILPLDPLPPGLLEDLREALDRSPVLSVVDIVDLSRVDPEFRSKVEREGVPWTR